MVNFIQFGQANENGLTIITNGFAKQIAQAINDGTNAKNAVAAISSLTTTDLAFSRFLSQGGSTNLLNGISIKTDPSSQIQVATTILLNAANSARGQIQTSIISLNNLAAQL